MPDESAQHRQGRVRPPRVVITTDVENYGELPKKHLPLLVGIIADLSADSASKLDPMAERQFVTIDRDNIDAVMKTAAPTLTYSVPDTISPREPNAPQGTIKVQLKFEKLSDFSPAAVAEQIPVLKKLLDKRKQLDFALAKVQTNGDLEKLFKDIIENHDTAKGVAGELQRAAAAAPKTGGQ